MILSGAVCGQIVDRFGGHNTILTVCMTAAVVALMLLRLPSAGLEASLLFGILGMAPAGVIIALAGEAMRPERRAFGMGVFFTVYYAIMMVAPWSRAPSSTRRINPAGRFSLVWRFLPRSCRWS